MRTPTVHDLRRVRCLTLEKFFQAFEYCMVRAMTSDTEDIFELLHLLEHLFQTVISL